MEDIIALSIYNIEKTKNRYGEMKKKLQKLKKLNKTILSKFIYSSNLDIKNPMELVHNLSKQTLFTFPKLN